jgi:hypothetical protein
MTIHFPTDASLLPYEFRESAYVGIDRFVESVLEKLLPETHGGKRINARLRQAAHRST